MWKLIRESVGLTQFQCAEAPAVDVTTIQGWESGRRPLPAISAGDLTRYRLSLIRAGADPGWFALLGDALEADLMLDDAIAADGRVDRPGSTALATTVHRRRLTGLATWPVTGVPPTEVHALVSETTTRRGPVPDGPVLGADERVRFFRHLSAIAERFRGTDDRLMRRQAIFLLAFDDAPQTRNWLAAEHLRAVRGATDPDDVGSWIFVRSSAVALAHGGDTGPLVTFARATSTSQRQAVANLNYWAYRVGESREIFTTDDFMRDPHARWSGRRLLHHLVDRLDPTAPQVELYASTLWQLLLARPTLCDTDPGLRHRAMMRLDEAMSSESLSARARRELSDVAYALRLGRG